MGQARETTTLRLPSELADRLRIMAGPRGMNALIVEVLDRHASGDLVVAEGTITHRPGQVTVKAQSLTRASASVIGHPFVPQKNSPFRCEVCGMNQGAHVKEA